MVCTILVARNVQQLVIGLPEMLCTLLIAAPGVPPTGDAGLMILSNAVRSRVALVMFRGGANAAPVACTVCFLCVAHFQPMSWLSRGTVSGERRGPLQGRGNSQLYISCVYQESSFHNSSGSLDSCLA